MMLSLFTPSNAATDEHNHKKMKPKTLLFCKGLKSASNWASIVETFTTRYLWKKQCHTLSITQLQLRVWCEHYGWLTFWRTYEFCSHNSVVHVVNDKVWSCASYTESFLAKESAQTPNIFHIFDLWDVFLSDFDGVQFHISNPDGEKSKLRVRYFWVFY